MALCVKTYPDLNIAALQKDGGCKRHDRELAIWYLLRFLDQDGNGKVKLTDLCRLVEDQAFMSLPNLQRRLRRGAGVFWDLINLEKGVQIQYRSLARVAAALDVLPQRAPVTIPLDAFRGLGSLRAYLYASWLNQGSNPISRQTIEGQTAIPKQTQIRYEKAAGAHKEKNLAVKRYEPGDQIPKGGFVSRDLRWLNVPLPNTYLPLLDQQPRGQLKKARRLVRGLWRERPTDQIRRRYFRDGLQAHKCKRRDRTYFVDQGREWQGYHLWSFCHE